MRWIRSVCALVVLIGDASCMAVDSSSVKLSKVVSTKRNGGISETFLFEGAVGPEERRQQRQEMGARQLIKQVQAGLRSTFLPSGFPTTTPPGYLSYSVWSWIQDLSTQLRGVLATQRVLEGVGVGREGATALSALMNFLVRDGCGMAATLLFTSAASSRFSADIKRWRLFADIMVDIGITLEVAATLVPAYLFLPMISVGNMCKAICGVAAGACGGAINLHWAKGSDISDIQAKFGAQHTVTGSLGLIFAAFFARSVAELKQRSLWTLYLSLTALHVYANMQCMKLISFDGLNLSRCNLLIMEFLIGWDQNQQQGSLKEVGSAKPPGLSRPESIAKREPLFFLWNRSNVVTKCPIHFGVSFNDLQRRSSKTLEELESLAQQSLSTGYMVVPNDKNRRLSVSVAFGEGATPETRAKAYFHAVLLSRWLKTSGAVDCEAGARETLERMWPAFAAQCDLSGWDLQKTELRSQGYELALVA